MRRVKLIIEYDGTPYVGMQAQRNGKSVQTTLEKAITDYTHEPCQVIAAGRTDSGVHAKAMVVHCDIGRHDTDFKVQAAINAFLRRETISVLSVETVSADFHARFDCVRRYYGYRMISRHSPLTFDRGFAWHVPYTLDLDAMNEGARHLLGKHDFTTFRAVHCQASSPVRTLDRLDVVMDRGDIWVHADARSFLHAQVRSMVGCLVMVGRGQWQPDDMKRALEAKDRASLGFNAPPDGLYFLKADYP